MYVRTSIHPSIHPYIHACMHACITLSDRTRPYMTVYDLTWPYMTLHEITWLYMTLHYLILAFITLHCLTSPYVTLLYLTLSYITLHRRRLHCLTVHYITVRCVTCMHVHAKPGQKFFLLTSYSNPLLRLLTGCTWMKWRIADQLVCFKRILNYSDLKYDPPRRPREMRIIDPRRSMMIILRHQTRKNFLPPDEHFPLNNFVFWWTCSTTNNCVLMSMMSFTAVQMVILNTYAHAWNFESSLRGNAAGVK